MDLHLDLARTPGSSLRARLEAALRDGIRTGLLHPETRLPSTRVLSEQLGVSRGVVVDAYAQLTAEGYLTARRGAGTTVATTGRPSDQPRRAVAAAPPAVQYDLSPFVPSLGAFPRTAWRAALGRVLRSAPDDRLDLPAGEGLAELRRALAVYLARARGVRTTPDQIVVTNGLRQGLSLLWPVLAAHGTRHVGVEHPGWRGFAETAGEAGLAVAPMPLDEDGLITARLRDRADVDAVAVAPAHQYPTGAVLSPARRAELVTWAHEHEAIVVEDDYDAEYRYDREPIGALQGLAPGTVVYGGSASKSLAPAIRLGWLVLPETFVEPVAQLQRVRGGMPAALEQLAFADLIERGELDRHLRRQRRRYRRKRDAVLATLAAQLPEATVHGAAAGLFVAIRLPYGTDEARIVAAARAAGVAVGGIGAGAPGLVLGYANLGEAAIEHAIGRLAQIVRQG
ncbi:MAG: PLP-dependent aminotransferase family protein [Solirubrobacteraceae bacterium]|nr:PLP-dependent aminotransferase family protein [Solirubrobacteraceae bacterium]